MKRICAFVLCLVLFILSSVSVCATVTDQNSVFYIEDLGMSIYTPLHETITHTRCNYDINPEDYNRIVSELKENNIYLWGYSRFYPEELFLYGNDSGIKSIHSFSDEGLEEYISVVTNNLESKGSTVTKSEIYKSYDTTYILTHFHDEDLYCISYYTIVDHKSIEIVLVNADAEPTLSQKQELVSIVNSIKYTAYNSEDTTPPVDDNDITIYDNRYIFSIAENGKLTPLGESLIATAVVVFIQLIAGIVLLIIFVNKAKKRRKSALSARTVQPKSKFCIYCGTELKTVNTFCHICGKKQMPAETPSTSENN